MFRRSITGCCVLAVTAACRQSTTAVEQPPPLPQPTEDRVGLPADYATQFTPFYVFDRPDSKAVRVAYANGTATAGRPHALGSIVVVETYRAKLDAQGTPITGADGRYQRDVLASIFVMRKEKWFGLRYGQNQTGDWEYASYRPDRSPDVVGDAAGPACAVCHLDAGSSRDWVYRANIFFSGASGAIPKASPNQPADQPFILNYTFVPSITTVRVGTKITWTNNDEVRHTVTAEDQTFSGLVPQGASVARTFSTAGAFNYFCAIHPTMKGSVVVLP